MTLQDQSLGQLARRIPGATRIFHDYSLDFCCGGKHTLREAAQEKGLDATAIEARLLALQGGAEPVENDWNTVSPAALIAHIQTRFHDRHREQLPELIRLARRVEHVHGDRPDCPLGLADHLAEMQSELEAHMQKEEQVLFPMLARGFHAAAGAPITVMRMEHDDHGAALQRLADLTNDITLPRAACNTWRALYLGLRTLREDLMEHIHLENNVLFEPGLPATHGAND
ncbi:iron-sulfur cluster repair protein YtfE (plasmid) [Cupriavidus necator H16]|uniref:Iron-sulfur cluster repair protein YtfE n=1 Tax=Cupriavidus necator (strain ATCC 17699 / DSM 428 / KCTC 22496 / NCIMB 10442 / H16 / Stanier 337) TaxID=381666 RepID=Q7WX96_CUPNH|nr:iron-sulfur cluster repair protein YtfE [Cupriavidus necator]AAP85994.1 NorA [Cupriavidus necator H16]QCC05480.1 iron-sulfur cluster repair protein YtfE [Cupriavidus necator H16]QQB81300.1 iron-sulfur cluster repair protein YtfE [Cupriavidus necator]